jgi:hypothetical protein
LLMGDAQPLFGHPDVTMLSLQSSSSSVGSPFGNTQMLLSQTSPCKQSPMSHGQSSRPGSQDESAESSLSLLPQATNDANPSRSAITWLRVLRAASRNSLILEGSYHRPGSPAASLARCDPTALQEADAAASHPMGRVGRGRSGDLGGRAGARGEGKGGASGTKTPRLDPPRPRVVLVVGGVELAGSVVAAAAVVLTDGGIVALQGCSSASVEVFTTAKPPP